MVSAFTDRFDGAQFSRAIKAPVQAVTSVAITLSGLQTVNGVAVVANDRVLVKDQADSSENGIYSVETGAWTRTPDFDGNRDATNGTLVVYATSLTVVGFYQLTATNPVVIGTTELTFTLVAALNLAAVLASTSAGDGASQVAIEDSGGFFTATDVEAALAELGGTTGTFETTWVGFTTSPTTTWTYTKVGNLVTMRPDSTLAATSNAGGFNSGANDMPALIRPSTGVYALYRVTDNGTNQIGVMTIAAAGQILFVADVTNATFTTSGTKGFIDRMVVSYLLD